MREKISALRRMLWITKKYGSKLSTKAYETLLSKESKEGTINLLDEELSINLLIETVNNKQRLPQFLY